MRHVTRLLDISRSELLDLLSRGKALREGSKPRQFPNKILGLVFEKPSTRTRISFEAAALRLGAGALFVAQRDTQLSRGEPVKDTSRVLGRYLDAVAMRTYAQSTIVESAKFGGIPVINALSDLYHPCQAVADLLTIEQHLDSVESKRVVYLGDGNNVFASLAEAAALVNFELIFCGPVGYDPDDHLLREVKELGGRISIERDPKIAVRNAHVLYTDVWTSMGQEAETEKRLKAFQNYQINQTLVNLSPECLVLHCLPAHRDEEITDEVIEGGNSVIFDQAENRMWAQMAILEAIWGAA